jgi:hypothetical protein
MVDPTSPSAVDQAPSDAIAPRQTWLQSIGRFAGGLLLIVIGASLVLLGVLGIFWLHSPGIGKPLGWMIMIGAVLVVGGWMTIKGE